MRGLSQYNAKNKRFRCDVVYTNIPVPGAYRGYGAPQSEFALEAHLEDIAHELGLDVLEFKRKNWVKVGDELDIAPHLGETAIQEELDEYPKVMTCGTEECVAQAQRAIGWHRRNDPDWVSPKDRPNIRRGIGFALAMHGSGIPFLDMGGASIKINDDGSFNLLIGATDIGTGADTVLGQIAAETLGVPLDRILVYSSDTDMTPFDVGAYASSTTYISGTAVKRAARRSLSGSASGRPCPRGGRRRRHPARRRGVGVRRPFGDARTGGAALTPPEGPGADHGRRVLHGRRLPTAVRGQDGRGRGRHHDRPGDRQEAGHGGRLRGDQPGHGVRAGRGRADQALGYAHCEYALDEGGRMLNAQFGPYKIYRADEMPDVEVYLVQTWEKTGPFGAKAVAEIPKDAVAPAVRNAILNATGVAIDNLPFTPERVWTALQRPTVGLQHR